MRLVVSCFLTRFCEPLLVERQDPAQNECQLCFQLGGVLGNNLQASGWVLFTWKLSSSFGILELLEMKVLDNSSRFNFCQ